MDTHANHIHNLTTFLTPTTYKHTTHSLEPGQMLNLGFMVEGPSADAVKLSGDVKVTEAEFCDS